MAPKLAKKATESLTRPLRSRLVVPFVFATSLILTFVTYFSARDTIALEEEHRLEQARLELEAQLAHRFQVYTELIEQARGMLLANPTLNPDEWRVFVESIQVSKRFPGIQGISFVKRVDQNQVAQLTATMRGFKGYEGFGVWPKPDKSQKFVLPVTMIEPLSELNKKALGFDVMSEEIRKETIDRAMATNSTQLSDTLRLVYETDNSVQPGLILFAPVFKRGASLELAEDREKALIGFISAIFRSHDLIQAALNSTTYYNQVRKSFDLEFFLDSNESGTQPRLLFDTDKVLRTGNSELSTDLRREFAIDLGGKQIKAYVHARPDFYKSSQPYLPNTILLVGLALTVFLTRILYVNSRQAERLRKSERQLRLVTDALPALISYIDKKLIYQFNNFAYETWFGKSRKDIVGCPVSEVLGRQNFTLVERAIHIALMGRIWEIECEIILHNGEARTCRATYIPDFALNGEVKGVVSLITDITDRKRDEERLDLMINATTMLHGSLEAEPTLTRFAQTLVPRLADWVAVHLVEGEDKLERVASVHRNPEKTALMVEVDRHFAHRKFKENPALQALHTGEPKLIRYMEPELISRIAPSEEHRRSLNEIGFASLMCIPLLARGRTLGVIILGRSSAKRAFDVEDLRFAVELGQRASLAVDNVRLYRETQLANRSKDEFLATVSHELRTPMNVILGWLEILRNENPDRQTLEQALQTLDRNARIQVDLINDLLDVSRIISGKMIIAQRPVAINEIVDIAVDSVLPAARAKSLSVESHIAPDLPLINADPDRIQQVLWNLLTNAVKFTPSGGKIEVTAKTDHSDVVIKVRDTGIGIEPRFLPFVFERFRQEDGSITRQHGGLGIGLALVRHLIEAHGGRVDVESKGKGFGSTFTVCLPIGSLTTSQGALPIESRHQVHQPEPQSLAKPKISKLDGVDVMLVDDSADVRVLLERILKKAGANVRSYSSAQEALEALKTYSPDVLVSDIGLPEMDGYSFIREIRSRETQKRSRHLPAAALTAFAQARDADHAIRCGFDKHIAKPVSADELLKAVQQLARLYSPSPIVRPPPPDLTM